MGFLTGGLPQVCQPLPYMTLHKHHLKSKMLSPVPGEERALPPNGKGAKASLGGKGRISRRAKAMPQALQASTAQSAALAASEVYLSAPIFWQKASVTGAPPTIIFTWSRMPASCAL